MDTGRSDAAVQPRCHLQTRRQRRSPRSAAERMRRPLEPVPGTVADFQLRPSRERERSRLACCWSPERLQQSAALRRPPGPRSYAFPHPGGEHSELVAIFSDRPASDLDAALAKNVHDRLVRKWVLRIFLLHELLELRFAAASRNILTVRSSQYGR